MGSSGLLQPRDPPNSVHKNLLHCKDLCMEKKIQTNNNCSKELPQYQKYDNLYKRHYFSFPFFSFFAQSILVTLLVKKMHVLSLNVFLEKSILDIPSIGDGAKNTFSRFFPMRALIFSVCKNYS